MACSQPYCSLAICNQLFAALSKVRPIAPNKTYHHPLGSGNIVEDRVEANKSQRTKRKATKYHCLNVTDHSGHSLRAVGACTDPHKTSSHGRGGAHGPHPFLQKNSCRWQALGERSHFGVFRGVPIAELPRFQQVVVLNPWAHRQP